MGDLVKNTEELLANLVLPDDPYENTYFSKEEIEMYKRLDKKYEGKPSCITIPTPK